MIHVAWPWMLLSLPLPWLLARWLPPAQPQGAALFLPFAAAVADASLPVGRPVSRPRKLLFALVWLLLVLAAIRPQWLGDPEAVAAMRRRVAALQSTLFARAPPCPVLAPPFSGGMMAAAARAARRLALVPELRGGPPIQLSCVCFWLKTIR